MYKFITRKTMKLLKKNIKKLIIDEKVKQLNDEIVTDNEIATDDNGDRTHIGSRGDKFYYTSGGNKKYL